MEDQGTNWAVENVFGVNVVVSKGVVGIIIYQVDARWQGLWRALNPFHPFGSEVLQIGNPCITCRQKVMRILVMKFLLAWYRVSGRKLAWGHVVEISKK
jgi:hypothetical protein